jgi:hypothetical protein
MHIFIDIRSWENPDPIIFCYARQWVKMWKKYHPYDTITYLVSTHDLMNIGDSSIFIPPSGIFSRAFRLRQENTGNMVFRIMNFSEFPPYDRAIPTISHIWDNSRVLYHLYSLPFFQRKNIEKTIRKMITDSRTIIVPDISIGRELVEIFDMPEERIWVLPFFPFSFDTPENGALPSFLQNRQYFLYDGWYGTESNIVKLLVEWGKYTHETENKPLLILLWLAWENLSLITQTLRSFELSESVKYLWYQNEEQRDVLYKHASWWIYVGEYYTGWPAISAAKSYWLPLLLSDIPYFQNENALRIHPQKLDTLRSRFDSFSTKQSLEKGSFDEEWFVRAYEKILSEA